MQPADIVIAVNVVQAAAALVLATLLLVFFRLFGHTFLRHWALSSASLAIYLAASTAALWLLVQPEGANSHLRLALSLAAMAVAYPHVVWLLMGAWEAVKSKTVSLRVELLLIGVAAAVGIASALISPFAAEAAELRNLLRVSIRHLLTGLAFIIAALMLWRAMRDRTLVSARLVPLAFLAYGLQLGYSSSVAAWSTVSGEFLPHTQYLGLVSFLLQTLIGYGIIIWLLEIERRRALNAQHKAETAETKLSHLRQHDLTTGLPNRELIQDMLGTALRRARDKRNRVGVLALGIHRFSVVKQALGWTGTEELLRQISSRVRTVLPRNFTLGRTGERDFLVIMADLGSRDRAMAQAEDLLGSVSQAIDHDGREVFVTFSGGLSFYPDDSRNASELIRMAQRAQLQAVAMGHNLALHQATSDSSEPRDMLAMEHALRRAVAENEFCLYFQPLVSIRERRITGFETLLRWNHPERGILAPGMFLRQAATIGVLDELEDHIFDQALKQLSIWQHDLSLPPLSVSINLTAQRFQQPDLPAKLKALCQKHDVEPGNVHLEITESTAMQDFQAGLQTIEGLREMGAKVCLDDFGSGYSSLAHLRQLRVDYIKLDRSFIAKLESDDSQQALTRAIVDLIHSLGMEVLAEGVETRSQLGFLIQCRVNRVQGFLLGKPAPAADYQSILDQGQLIF